MLREHAKTGIDAQVMRASGPFSLWTALAWIAGYMGVVNLGDAVSNRVGVDNSVTSLLLIALAAMLIVLTWRAGTVRYYGLRWPRAGQARSVLWYAPLVPIVALLFAKGGDSALTATAIVWIVLLHLCVGFLEEFLFRGMLYRAIRERGTVRRAVVVSGVTFGIGHIVNLARGYTAAEQTIQIVYGISLGIVLALLVAVTGSILPLVAFHALLNITGTITREDIAVEGQLAVVMVILCAGYAWWLIHVLRRDGEVAVDRTSMGRVATRTVATQSRD